MTALEWKDKGNAALKAGDVQRAVECFSAGLDAEPGHAVLLSNRSAAYAALGDYDNALADGEAAVAAKPDWSKAYSRKALALFMLGRGEDAVAAYEAGLKVEPDNAALQSGRKSAQDLVKATEFTVLGEEFMSKRKYTAARDHFKQACELAPHSRLFWSNLSEAHTHCGEFDDAIKAAERCMQVSPAWHRGAQRKAEALAASRRYEEALPFFARALQLSPTNAQSITHAFNKCQQDAFNASRREQYEAAGKQAAEKEASKKAKTDKADTKKDEKAKDTGKDGAESAKSDAK